LPEEYFLADYYPLVSNQSISPTSNLQEFINAKVGVSEDDNMKPPRLLIQPWRLFVPSKSEIGKIPRQV
jgi:hypothetical protein